MCQRAALTNFVLSKEAVGPVLKHDALTNFVRFAGRYVFCLHARVLCGSCMRMATPSLCGLPSSTLRAVLTRLRAPSTVSLHMFIHSVGTPRQKVSIYCYVIYVPSYAGVASMFNPGFPVLTVAVGGVSSKVQGHLYA